MTALPPSLIATLLGLGLPLSATANTQTIPPSTDLLDTWAAPLALGIFVVAYVFVILEERTHMRKSKPVLLAAGLIWGLIAWVGQQQGISHEVEAAARHSLLEYAELMLFLLVAMTYINAMAERQVFAHLRVSLIRAGLGYRQLFWLTGFLAFFISPVADNLTTALLLGAVIMAIGIDSPKFIALSCINIVCAANAGGAFSPFGDITTLMVWQKGLVDFEDFGRLFIPSFVNFILPAFLMHFAVPNKKPTSSAPAIRIKLGGRRIIALFLLTIITAVCFHSVLELPPVMGMLLGLAYLQLFGYYLKLRCEACRRHDRQNAMEHICSQGKGDDTEKARIGSLVSFDIFRTVARAEWDTLLFFYGVVMAVGGLGFLGYLDLLSHVAYTEWGSTQANIAVGGLSSVVDNIPVMVAVLSMNPDMPLGQWLLVTLTAGVGGSLLSIGSAAGVALMGQTRGIYTFFAHVKWLPVLLLGYAASIAVHLWLNASVF
ncbi:MAG: sodium:proton antiporter NhaD [bacterium]